MVAIPMIAGLGAEVTPMATVLRDDDPIEPERVRKSFMVSRSGVSGSCCALPNHFACLSEVFREKMLDRITMF